jgi:zinc transporter 9
MKLCDFFVFFFQFSKQNKTKRTLGLLLLFSAGTFLYVATVHILPELQPPGRPLAWKKIFVLCLGVFLPWMIGFEHHH